MQPLREFQFRLRNALRWSPPAWKRRVSLEVLRGTLEAQGRARLAELERRYALSGWGALCTLGAWRESLYVLDLLSQHLPQTLPEGRALDVGAKNGTYLPGLAAALPRGWDAVELDAHRRYAWGSTRRAYGEAMARGLPGCRFIAADVQTLEGPWAFVSWFLPFLSRAPLDAWGLPARALAPAALLRHVTQRVLPGGALFVVNQGEAEAQTQAALFAQLGLPVRSLGRIDSPLSPFRKARFGLLYEA